jgi:target of rapamycin complex 2 subunit MAPKAP1
MYMQDALESVCRRRRLEAKEYALLLSELNILIPLDRTVASLQGKSDLTLVKRSRLEELKVDVRPSGRSTDPNGMGFPFSCTVRMQALLYSDRVVSIFSVDFQAHVRYI